MSGISKVEGRLQDGKYFFFFPEEVTNQNYMMLQVLEKTRSTKTEPSKKNVGRVFVLPIPGQLAVGSKMDYESKGIGAFGALAAGRGVTSGAMDDISGLISNKFNQVANKIGTASTVGAKTDVALDEIMGEGQTLTAAGLAVGATVAGTKLGKLGVGALAGAATGGALIEGHGLKAGLAVNPHLAVLFKGVGLRSFGFQYKFVARNQQESIRLRDMIRALQYHMHPDYFAGNFAFRYPDEFRIEFSENRKDWLFDIKDCVLTDMNINYNGEGMPLFFDDVGGPVSVDIQMTFQETQILTKRDYSENYETERGKPDTAKFRNEFGVQGGNNPFRTRG